MSDETVSTSPSSWRADFDTVLAKLMRAIDNGESIVPDWWFGEYPEHQEDLIEFFARHQRVEDLVRPLRSAAANILHVRCPHCHNPIELIERVVLSDISCPSCGSNFSLVAEETCSHHLATEKFGHFQLIERVGVGQFGSVWMARDTKLDRTVAIKVPRNGRMDTAQTDLFLRDARAAAQLKHPNIVSVHEVGKQGDTIYIVSDFIRGATLKEWTKSKPLTPRESAALCIKIARALEHAHQSGVIHRDLKPGNIMMDTEGDPHIVDFGLAKREAGEVTMTVEGQILGTPAYMSPEQARGEGHQVDRRADIYSLGVILFELLTGELPFRGDKQMLIVQIVHDDPPSPRKLNIGVPRDLETICLKCLEKEPPKRYETALSLSHDLDRFMHHEPIEARAISRLERAGRWSRRHPQVASLLALTGTLLAAITGLTSWGYIRELGLRQDLEKSHGDIEKLNTDITTLRADIVKGQDQLESGRRFLNEVNHDLRGINLQRALDAWTQDNAELADYYLHLCPKETRDEEWHELRARIRPQLFRLPGKRCVAIHPSGSLIAGAGPDGLVRLWELESGQLKQTLQGHAGDVTKLAFNGDGSVLASAIKSVHDDRFQAAADGNQDETIDLADSVYLWDVSSGSLIRSFPVQRQPITDLTFSPSGELAVATLDTLTLYDMKTGESRDKSAARYAVFDHDASHMAMAENYYDKNGKKRVRLVIEETNTQKVDWVTRADARVRPALHPNKNQFAFSQDSINNISFAKDWHVTPIWTEDVRTQQSIQHISFEGRIDLLAYTPDARRLVYAGRSPWHALRPHTFHVVIWNLITEQQERVIPWFESEILELDVSPDGTKLATATKSEILVWDITPPHDPTEEIVADIVERDVGRLDSPMWGGSPSRINTPFGKQIPTSWNTGKFDRRTGEWHREQAENIKWMAPLGSQTFGNPVVANGRVFIGTNNGSGYLERYPPQFDLGVLLCFKEATGEFLWQHSNEKLITGRVHDWPLQGVCSTPMVDGNRLWYVSNRGEIVCLDTEGFYDDEDDGPHQEEWIWLAKIRPEDLLTDRLSTEFAARGLPWKEDYKLRETGRGSKSWFLHDGDSQLIFRIDRRGSRHEVTMTPRHDLFQGIDEELKDFEFHSQIFGDQTTARVLPGLLEHIVKIGLIDSPKVTGEWSDQSTYEFTVSAGGEPAEFRLRRMEVRYPNSSGWTLTTKTTDRNLREADVVWKFNMMKELGVSQHNMANCSILTADGVLFACTSNGLDESHRNLPAPDAPSFIAMDRDTGKLLWTDNSPGKNILHAQWGSPSYGVFNGQPQVIFSGGDGWVYSFDPQGDGQGGSKLLWKFDGNPKNARWILGGEGDRDNIIAFPAIYDGLVYITMGQDPEHGEGESRLWCIDPARHTDGSDISAELAVNDNGKVIPHRRVQAVCENWVQIFRESSTKTEDRINESTLHLSIRQLFDRNQTTLAEPFSVRSESESEWIVKTSDALRYRVRQRSWRRGNGYSRTVEQWFAGERAVPNPKSAVVWQYTSFDQNGDGQIDFEEEFHRSLSTPVIKDDILYTADFSGLVHCLHAKTGEVYWTYDMLAQCWSSPLLVDGKLYIGDEDGDVLVMRHIPDGPIPLRQFKRDGEIAFKPVQGLRPEVIDEFNMGASIYMTPIVANNVIYIATKSRLFAIAE